MNTLTLTDKQMKVVETALEVYDRLNGGQMSIAIEELEKNKDFPASNVGSIKRDNIEYEFRTLFDKEHSNARAGSSSWVGNEKALIARDIRATIRQEFAFREEPEGGMLTKFDGALPFTDEPIPVIQPNYKNETARAPFVMDAGMRDKLKSWMRSQAYCAESVIMTDNTSNFLLEDELNEFLPIAIENIINKKPIN